MEFFFDDSFKLLIFCCTNNYFATIFRSECSFIGSYFRKIVLYLLYFVCILEIPFELIKNQLGIIWGHYFAKNHEGQRKLCDAKKQCITYRAMQKKYFIKENFEGFEASHHVFLQKIYRNFTWSVDFSRFSESILDGKVDEKKHFLRSFGQ